jgi:hypothetical protein
MNKEAWKYRVGLFEFHCDFYKVDRSDLKEFELHVNCSFVRRVSGTSSECEVCNAAEVTLRVRAFWIRERKQHLLPG